MTNVPMPNRASRANPVPPAAGRRARVPLAWPLALLAGATIVALAAQVAVPVPGSPVPITLQGLAVLLVGGLFGAAIGTGALVLYLLAGAFGLPVFAPVGPSGLLRLIGPTGGYLLAFPVAAAIVGRLALRGDFTRCLVASFAGMVIIHFGGWAQLTVLTGDAARSASLGIAPFILQDLLKVMLAAVVLWRSHHAFRLRA
jgi:biotin transport system substrate-specific component